MNFFVTYVLYSEAHRKTYVGYTSSIISRFYSHNFFSNKGYTVRFRPWKVLEVSFYDTKSKAMKHEKYLKSGQGRAYIKNELIVLYKKIGFLSA